ncbi:hypothetical protein B0H17DRAFT_1154823 [Mycena rosella]|uniref:Uncharacterized protein n=1 Tax=Mycena rosella TaxID=1033263 RepID=A0AAD7F8I5_MYCRO|nr:hypothetical protein B0H17DRAFT_1154823 [Mycena rosella]
MVRPLGFHLRAHCGIKGIENQDALAFLFVPLLDCGLEINGRWTMFRAAVFHHGHRSPKGCREQSFGELGENGWEDYGFTKVWTRTEKIYLVPTEVHAWRTSGTLQEHFQRDIAEELISGVQQGDVWGWFFRNVDLFRPPASSMFPRTSTAREGYSSWKEMPPRILDSIACMRDAVHLNVIPKNPNTLADYGFTRTDQRDHGMLLAVYTALFIDKGVYPSDILLLCDAGILKNNIIAKMHVLEWFENNLYVFEDDKPVSRWEASS